MPDDDCCFFPISFLRKITIGTSTSLSKEHTFITQLFQKMKTTVLPLFLVCVLYGSSGAFTPRSTPARSSFSTTSALCSSENSVEQEQHPAVEGWPEKYVAEGGSEDTKDDSRVISETFEVHPATESELNDLDVRHWPTWTTGDKPKWDVGNKVVDKEMPYGELSYMITGKLEIIPKSTGVPVIVSPGDLVTFPKGFVASWQVLEELTWHYYLY